MAVVFASFYPDKVKNIYTSKPFDRINHYTNLNMCPHVMVPYL